MPWIALAFTLVAAGYDLKTREVPDWIPLALLPLAVTAKALGFQEAGWLSLLGGVGLGFALGAVLFAVGVMGGGDVKLIAALGASLGVAGLLVTLFWTTLAGGVFALLSLARGKHEVAYAPAITLGLLMSIVSQSPWANGLAF